MKLQRANPRCFLTGLTVLILFTTGAACALVPEGAKGSLRTGFSAYLGDVYTSDDPQERDEWWDKTVAARADLVRINLSWRTVTVGQPLNPSNPLDPAYDFSRYDPAVREAADRGLDVLLTIFSAPSYAEGPDRPQEAPDGTWKPDPAAFGTFARAVAARYSGMLPGLPRIRYFQAWNEPNLSVYLTPQWAGKRPVGPSHYRRMLNAFESGIHEVYRDNVVVTGGTSPYGDDPGGSRTRPLTFIRELLCLKEVARKLQAAKCSEKASFDVLAHHPINLSGGPRKSAIDPDDASTPDFKHVRRTLRYAERRGRVRGGRHDVWATEIWWESNPPDTARGVSLARQARWIQESFYLLWKQGAEVVLNLSIRDGPYDPDKPLDTIEDGIYFHDGSPKPGAQAFRFPFVVERKGRQRGLAWGTAPESGEVKIQQKRGNGWRTVGTRRVRSGQVFSERVSVARGRAELRATLGNEESLTWVLR